MKKIMFDDRYGLTKAVLGGQKTMTRRKMTPQPSWVSADGHIYNDSKPPRFKVGEVVAVAQSYGAILDELEDPRNFSCMEHFESKSGDRGKYAEMAMYSPGGNNKMFVCADLMIHQIRITNVRVERLQDISDEDCLREGISKPNLWRPHNYTAEGLGYFEEAREAFATLINKISGNGTFESNPWVFVYEFELVK